MNVCLLVEECVSAGDVLGLHRLDQTQGRVSFVESTRATTWSSSLSSPPPGISSPPPPHFLPSQDDPREEFLSASKQIGLGQTKAADSDKLKLRETRVTMPVRGLFLSRETCADSQSLVMARSGLGHLGTHGFG